MESMLLLVVDRTVLVYHECDVTISFCVLDRWFYILRMLTLRPPSSYAVLVLVEVNLNNLPDSNCQITNSRH